MQHLQPSVKRRMQAVVRLIKRKDDNGECCIFEKNLNNNTEEPSRIANTTNSAFNTDTVTLFDENYCWIVYRAKDTYNGGSSIRVTVLGEDSTNQAIPYSSEYLDNQIAEFSTGFSSKGGK
ncbi:hypothetical protein ACHAPT_013085 [Fusarium lateritium]